MNNNNSSEETNKRFILSGNIILKMIWCAPGAFFMGSPKTEYGRRQDERLHCVNISHGFWIGQFAVTQEQYKTVTNEAPSGFSGKKMPVDSVSHSEAQAFCHMLKSRIVNSKEIPENSHFALPTEAQWEYACRAGTQTPFHYGEQLDSFMANFDGQHPYGTNNGVYRQKSCSVGCFAPNPWNIYDMHGNISEWCLDGYGKYEAEATDPLGEDIGLGMIRRGGSWGSRGGDCRSARRNHFPPGCKSYYLGFRLVLNTKSYSIKE